MVSFRIIFLAILAFLVGCYGQNAFASGSGSYAVETPDAGAMGMGSAFVGEADTPAAIYYNPAGINQISSPEVTLGDAVIAPRSQMTTTSGEVVHEENNEYNIPNYYVVVPLIPHKLSVGIGGGSYWGTGTSWGDNTPFAAATTQATIQDIDNSLVADYQVTDQWSLAVSADNDYSRADESKSLVSAGLGNVELKGGDDTWGYRIATMYKINDKNQVGLMYRSRIDHTYEGKLSVNGANPGFGFTNMVSNVTQKSVLPQSVIAGYSFKPTSKWTINIDVEWMDWSSTKYQTINTSNPTFQQLGFGNPTPADWHSTWSESIGTQYDVTDRFRVRMGYYHHEGVIPDAAFNPAIPDSNSNGYTAGFGYDVTSRLTLDVAYSALIYDARNIINSVSSPEGNVDGKYKTFVNIGLVSLTYKF